MNVKYIIFTGFAALTITSCAGGDKKPTEMTCPDIGAVTIATHFEDADKRFTSDIKKVRGACLVKDGVIDLDFYIDTLTTNNTLTPDSKINVPVFTAMLDEDKKPLEKKTGIVELTLPPVDNLAPQTHTVNVRYKMPDGNMNPADYHIVIGFQLEE